MGCCLVVVILFLLIAALAIYVCGMLIAWDIIMFAFVISSAIKKSEVKKMKPSRMVCPNCKSKIVKIANVRSGSTTSGTYGRGYETRNTSINYKRIAECKECGYGWHYITKEDIEKEMDKANGCLVLSTILFVISMAVTIHIFG